MSRTDLPQAFGKVRDITHPTDYSAATEEL